MRFSLNNNYTAIKQVAEYAGMEREKFEHNFLEFLSDKDFFGKPEDEWNFKHCDTLRYWADMSELSDSEIHELFEGFIGKPITDEMRNALLDVRVTGYRCPYCGSIDVDTEYINYRSWSRDGADFEEDWDGERITCKKCHNTESVY